MRIVVAPCSRACAAASAYTGSCSSSARSACGWERISARKCAPSGSGNAAASGNDTRFAADADAVDLEVVVEHDQVGREPDVEAADRGEAQHASWDGRGRLECVGEGNAELVEVSHGVDHRQRAAGEDVVDAPHDAVADSDLGAGEQVVAV